MEKVRLNLYLSRCGLCSRREADRLVESGRVTVNGEVAALGLKVDETDSILVDGKPVGQETETVVLAVNKPAGIVCTSARFKGEKNIIDMVNYPVRLFTVGRLDKASEGLVLLTNDGGLADNISRGRNGHEKEYQVTVDKTVTADFVNAMQSGVTVEIDGEMITTRRCKVKKTSVNSFDIILTQGLNRQIRRMCEALGYRVRTLKRVRVMNVLLSDTPSGGFRKLTPEEIKGLLVTEK